MSSIGVLVPENICSYGVSVAGGSFTSQMATATDTPLWNLLRSGTFAQGRFTLALDSKNFLIPVENLVQLHDNDASSHKPFD
jgi:hypothetical protein